MPGVLVRHHTGKRKEEKSRPPHPAPEETHRSPLFRRVDRPVGACRSMREETHVLRISLDKGNRSSSRADVPSPYGFYHEHTFPEKESHDE